jgi:hypothetical protein
VNQSEQTSRVSRAFHGSSTACENLSDPSVRPFDQVQIRNLGAASAIGLAAGALSFVLFPLHHGGDFVQFHYHAQSWLAGRDPYAGGYPVMRATRLVPEPLFYPFPTLLAVAPFTLLPVHVATAAFVAITAALLAFGLVRRSPERLPLFLGAGFFVALVLGQWSPLITATLVLPSVAWLAVLKPNIGFATTASRPTWRGIVGGALLLVSTLAIQPNWPGEWLRNLHSMPAHPAPLFGPGGVLLLLALLRWRRWEARLLVAMACVPQLMYFADQLPLWFIPRARRESLLLSATSVAAWAAALITASNAGRQPAFSSELFVLAGVYLPCLWMVLSRPNEGAMPAWIERVASGAPRWLSGQRGAQQ